MYDAPGRSDSSRPSLTPQIRVIESPHVVAINDASGLNAIAVTVSLCPRRVNNSCLDARSQITAERSSTLAIIVPSGLNTGAMKWPIRCRRLKAGPSPSVGSTRTASAVWVASHRLSGLKANSHESFQSKLRCTRPVSDS